MFAFARSSNKIGFFSFKLDYICCVFHLKAHAHRNKVAFEMANGNYMDDKPRV